MVVDGAQAAMDQEYRAISSTLNSFHKFYSWQFGRVVRPKAVRLHSLSPEEQAYLPWYPGLVEKLRHCTQVNRDFTEELALMASQDWGIATHPDQWEEPKETDFDKVRATLLQFVREWTEDGAVEREKTIDRIVRKACELYPNVADRAQVKVLVPGCGLGRQVFEFARAGFWTQGNEVSYHMLTALGYVLNSITQPKSRHLFPYIHKLAHMTLRSQQLRPVSLPDVCPHSVFFGEGNKDAHLSDLMSMVAGSFVDLYGPPEIAASEEFTDDPQAEEFRTQNSKAYDIISTCFFLDTAHNVIDYLKTIKHALKNDGVWINLGPLHWHFEGDQTTRVVKRADVEGQIATSIPVIMEGMELTREELFELMDAMGFDIVEHESGIDTIYSSDATAMSNFHYGCEYWVAKLRGTI